jgi:hypothetical protein
MESEDLCDYPKPHGTIAGILLVMFAIWLLVKWCVHRAMRRTIIKYEL